MNTGVQPFETPVSRTSVKSAVCCVVVLLLATVTSQAGGWRGIVPLHSTRADVERLLGRPARVWMGIYFYEFEAERVKIFFSEGPCGTTSSSWNVVRETVTAVSVTPQPGLLKLADLKLDSSKFKREADKHVGGVINYVNEEEGVTYQVDTNLGDAVALVSYYPAAKDAHLRCPSSEASLEGATRVDSYSGLHFGREKRRLDSFAKEINKHPNSQAYIMAYAGRRSRAAQAEAHAKRAKDYLIKTHRVDAKRIVTINGGYREKPSVELYLVPLGGQCCEN